MPKQAGHSCGRLWRALRQLDAFTGLAWAAALGLPWLLLLGEAGAVAYGLTALVVLLWFALRELARMIRQA